MRKEFWQVRDDDEFFLVNSRLKQDVKTGFYRLPKSKLALNQQGHDLGCCDCGLVHKFDFSIVEIAEGKNAGKLAVALKVRRNEAATKRLRKQQGRNKK